MGLKGGQSFINAWETRSRIEKTGRGKEKCSEEKICWGTASGNSRTWKREEKNSEYNVYRIRCSTLLSIERKSRGRGISRRDSSQKINKS